MLIQEGVQLYGKQAIFLDATSPKSRDFFQNRGWSVSPATMSTCAFVSQLNVKQVIGVLTFGEKEVTETGKPSERTEENKGLPVWMMIRAADRDNSS